MSATDLAVLDVVEVEMAADPAVYVIQACERAKTWLAHALEHGGIDQILEMKCQAEAIRVYTMSKQLGMDAQLSAAEIVRRAERGIGLAVRKGQAEGTIAKSGEHSRWGNQHGGATLGESRPSPKDYFSGGQDLTETYAMTDGITESQFDEAISEARAEGNLSRRNVARKTRAKRETVDVKRPVIDEPAELDIPDSGDRSGFATLQRRAAIRAMAGEGYTSKQMAEKIGRRDDVIRQMAREMGVTIPADTVTQRTRAIDPNRVVRETVHALEGLAMGVGLILDDLSGLDPAEAKIWAASLTDSTRTLNRLIKAMKEMTQ